ncbi:MAG: sigma-54-dependent Fis family transcriptional regulator [Planctomycetes bacterium]|nr:sigma-54-dependent Fis family transcriptional regulator [Planctomycetota bacterium]
MEVFAPPGPLAVSQPIWQNWSHLPWLERGNSAANELQFCFRLLESAAQTDGLTAFLKHELPEVASEFAAQWVGIVQRGSDWERLGEFGRLPVESLPFRLMTEALERDAAGLLSVSPTDHGSGWVFCAAPLHKGGTSSELLVLCGRGLTSKSLVSTLAVAWALGWAVDVARRRDGAAQRVDRLRTTLRIASQLTTARDSTSLLAMIAREAARLLDADRSSIFMWDRAHHEVVACQALGYEGRSLRLPDKAGIVGECLQTGKSITVEEAYSDSRFHRQVDVETGYKTRNLLCVPLVDPQGQIIGVFEALNKRHGAFNADDEESLTELGVQAAAALANTREHEHLARRHRHLTEQVTRGVTLIGNSPAIVALRSTVDRLAATDLPVLILGESGTGKEVVAQSLHYAGSRRDNPFIAVNCAAVTESLLESELFGHEKGAFTDAREAHQGKFELAEGGTLFLDEIGDMSAAGQAKLLRVLEQKVITRVGGSQPIHINVRVVAATNVNLAEAVRNKKFREDLYYRLSVVALELLPLRARPDDILPLAEHFLERFGQQARRKPLALSPEARARLMSHSWPGNVRELRNLMERVSFLCTNDRVEPADLEFILSPNRDPAGPDVDLRLTEATSRFQREYIRRTIKRAAGNMTDAATLLGLHRSNLYRKMRQLKMSEVPEESN